jgi:hypothetical protein
MGTKVLFYIVYFELFLHSHFYVFFTGGSKKWDIATKKIYWKNVVNQCSPEAVTWKWDLITQETTVSSWNTTIPGRYSWRKRESCPSGSSAFQLLKEIFDNCRQRLRHYPSKSNGISTKIFSNLVYENIKIQVCFISLQIFISKSNHLLNCSTGSNGLLYWKTA